jgi:hypothetical protein
MEIIEQKYITSLRDIGHLNVIDFSRCNRYWEDNLVIALECIGDCLMYRSAYTIVHEDMRKYPDRDDFPDWEHVGKTHKPLGKLFWNMFHALYKGDLLFHDMPDFSGTMIFDGPISQVNFMGDIGRVSASTFALEVLHYVHKGDLWISVVSEDTHIVIEFLEDIGMMINEHIAKVLRI